MRFSTKAIHAGQDPDPATGSVTVPVYLTSTYMQAKPGREGKYVYSRTANPTRNALEQSLAALEEGKVGLAFSSGLAATTTVLMLLRKGDHVVAGDDIYGGTYRLFDQVLRNYGLQFTYVDPRSPDNVEKAVRKNTKMIWIETPTNPLMRVVDIRAISKIATKNHTMLVVDNTFASPYLQNPLKLGADISVHSTTKYLGGHSDLIGGAAITADADIGKRLKFLQNAVGAIPGPLDCWLVLRGIKTLAVRMDRHNSNAKQISEFLLKQPKVEQVYYPGLPGHPQRDVVKRQRCRVKFLIEWPGEPFVRLVPLRRAEQPHPRQRVHDPVEVLITRPVMAKIHRVLDRFADLPASVEAPLPFGADVVAGTTI